MMHPWPDLKWWECGERQVVEEKIDDLKRAGIVCNPAKGALYSALRATPFHDCRVAIIGQDPYPTSAHATGIAFSVPDSIQSRDFPQTLKILFNEYHYDLGYPIPDKGELSGWTKQGVLLWNAIPSVQAGRPLSNDWEEWKYLTGEIIVKLAAKGIVFALLGAVARQHAYLIGDNNRVIVVSHPSPRGIRNSKTPFTGSRIFSTINARLRELGKEPCNWNLDEEGLNGTSRKGNLSTPIVGGGTVLQNITGAQLGGLKRTATSPNIYTSLAF